MTFPTALAAPVPEGMMFCWAPLPPLQSLPLGPSTHFCVAVTAWTVVIRPSTRPKLSLMTLASGARQLVVQEALETTLSLGSYFLWLTPITYMGASGEGAEISTFFAPPLQWKSAFSLVVNTPVDSTMYSAPALAQLMSAGFFSLNTVIFLPFT